MNLDKKIIEEAANIAKAKNQINSIIGNVSKNNDDSNFDKVMEQFKMKCPVKKINFYLENPNCISGAWMLIDKDSIDKLNKKADLTDLNDDTYLFFTNQHIVELGGIINGMLYLFESNKWITKEERLLGVRKFMLFFKELPTYKEYLNFCNDLRIDRTFNITQNNAMKAMYDKMDSILNILPFISYADIDSFAVDGINSFKNYLENNSINKDEVERIFKNAASGETNSINT